MAFDLDEPVAGGPNDQTVRRSTAEGRRGAVAVIRRGQQFLVICRSQSVAAPGAYCFPGGTIEAGETEREALVRELQEELNLTVEPVCRLWSSITP